MSNRNWKPETIAVHGGYSPDPSTKAVAVPIYQTVAYAFDNTQHGADLFDLKVTGNIYSRIMNPTNDVLEQRVAALEGGIAALALASGQAAITYAIQTIAEAGDNIVSSSALYGGTYNLFAHTFPQFGIETRFADHRDPNSFAKLIDDKTKAIFVESIGNPLGNITDIEAVAKIAHAHGVPLTRGRYRRPLTDQVPRRARHQHRRGDCGLGQIPLGRARQTLPAPEYT